MRRTWSVRRLNLGAPGGKSAAKMGAREFPRVLLNVLGYEL